MVVQWNAGRVAGAALLMSAMAAASAAAAEAAEAAGDTRQRALDAIVVTAQAPQDGVAWETDPKLPRQPVPASDGADYLKTIPGFTAIRNGGSNGDPVLRGMFGSRLNLLSNEGSMPGACPSRMDNPMSYVAPETFDRLVVVKGPQTVLWGPGASAGTVRFERDGARFDTPGARINASALVGSNGRRDALIDASAGLSQGYIRVTGNHSEADDYRAGEGSRVPSRWEKWNADVMLGWTPDADTLLEIGLGRGDGEARYAGRRMDGTMFDRDAQSIRFEKSGFDGALKAIEASAYRNEVDHLMDNYTLREPNPRGPMPMPMASNVDRLTYGGRAAATFDTGRWELTPGVDAQNSRHRRRNAMGRDAYLLLPRTQDADLRQRGAFVEAALPPAPRRAGSAGCGWTDPVPRTIAAPPPACRRSPRPGKPAMKPWKAASCGTNGAVARVSAPSPASARCGACPTTGSCSRPTWGRWGRPTPSPACAPSAPPSSMPA